MLKKGDHAPDFTLSNSKGQATRLVDYAGQTLVLYFYPRNHTAGCTKEALAFKESYSALKSSGSEVLGISPDTTKSHSGFREKHQLPFELLSDTDRKIALLYGVLGEKKMYGKVTMGIIRSTFLIDPAGVITEVISGVKAEEHAHAALTALGNK